MYLCMNVHIYYYNISFSVPHIHTQNTHTHIKTQTQPAIQRCQQFDISYYKQNYCLDTNVVQFIFQFSGPEPTGHSKLLIKKQLREEYKTDASSIQTETVFYINLPPLSAHVGHPVNNIVSQTHVAFYVNSVCYTLFLEQLSYVYL